jgi:hypothetical protein
MATLSLKLPAALAARLDAAARRRGINKSELVRQALEAFLEGGLLKEKATFGDAARDLIGCLDGPRNLSSVSRRLQDYGR